MSVHVVRKMINHLKLHDPRLDCTAKLHLHHRKEESQEVISVT